MPTPDRSPGRPGVPAPPGGHALWVDPDELRQVQAGPTASLPVSEEISAGGVVVDHDDPDLPAAVIARRTRGGRLEWCLPKGHLEGVETAEEAAVREIREETGIEGRVDEHVGTIDYWFTGDERRVHKVVHHYLLSAVGGRLTVEDDPDHEAEDAAWIPIDQLVARLAYPNERRVAHAAREVLLGRRATVHVRSSFTHRTSDAS
jgi:8-oxo-dGTP pyrophosphatase MutT (NUDIX family)